MRNRIPMIALVFSALLLFGCSRTVDDVARWTAAGNVDKLIAALEDPKPAVRESAANGLGELKADAAIDPLVKRFHDPEKAVMLGSVKALVAIGSESATLKLVEALEIHNTEAHVLAAKGLAQIKSPATVDALVGLLDDSDETLGVLAAQTLGAMKVEKATEPLAEKAVNSSGQLQLACLEALGDTSGMVAIRALVAALSSETTAPTAIASLIKIGKPVRPTLLDLLRSDQKAMRAGAVAILEAQPDLIPTEGADLIWFQLARVSSDADESFNLKVAKSIMTMEAVDVLLEAAAHSSGDIRQHAAYALEWLGEPCTSAAVVAANQNTGAALEWYKNRTTWKGAPSWRLDLWGAIVALNPEFVASPDLIPQLIIQLGDPATQKAAKEKLAALKLAPVLPLIAALGDSNLVVANQAADLLKTIGDRRAIEPLKEILKRKISVGAPLSKSAFYSALQTFEDPQAEALLLRIRPNADRAMRIFDRKYSGIRAISAESQDELDGSILPIRFRVGFVDGGRMNAIEIVFARNNSGDWVPTPPLPEKLPKLP